MRETPILEFSKKDLNYIHNPLNKEDKIYIRSLKASFFINNKDFMNLLDFKVKKYGGAFVDLKVLKIEYKKNEIKRKKYFYLKYKKGKTRIEEIEVEELKRLIIW